MTRTLHALHRPATQIIGDPTIAGAILDRLIHNAHRLILKGDSQRKTTAKTSGLDGAAQA